MKSKSKKINNGPSGKKGAVLWLTGLSGAGKSTIGDRLSKVLQKRNIPIQRLDGNLVKGCFGNGFNFNEEDHDFNIKLAAFVGSVLEKHGILVIASFITPYERQREFVRNASTHFIEVYIKASINTCIKRDVKGFYKKAINGELKVFPGFSYPYEIPKNPNLVIDTDKISIESSVKKILDLLLEKKYIIK